MTSRGAPGGFTMWTPTRSSPDAGLRASTGPGGFGMTGEVIQGLWVGERLSVMERLSIASFLHHGHAYHLYTYGPVAGLPAGAVRQDARAILPESMIFQYRDHASYAGFSNYFRYKLLLERGGWWVDT